MTPLSRAIWLLARLGMEAEKNEEVAPLLGGPEATSEEETLTDSVALSASTHNPILHSDAESVNPPASTVGGEV